MGQRMVTVAFVADDGSEPRLARMTADEFDTLIEPAVKNNLPIDTSTIDEGWYDYYRNAEPLTRRLEGRYHQVIPIV